MRSTGWRTNVRLPHVLTPASPRLCMNACAKNLRAGEAFSLQGLPDGTVLSPTGPQKQDTSESRRTRCVDSNILFI